MDWILEINTHCKQIQLVTEWDIIIVTWYFQIWFNKMSLGWHDIKVCFIKIGLLRLVDITLALTYSEPITFRCYPKTVSFEKSVYIVYWQEVNYFLDTCHGAEHRSFASRVYKSRISVIVEDLYLSWLLYRREGFVSLYVTEYWAKFLHINCYKKMKLCNAGDGVWASESISYKIFRFVLQSISENRKCFNFQHSFVL